MAKKQTAAITQPTHVRTFQRNGKTYWVDGTEKRGDKWFVSVRSEGGSEWKWIPYLD